MAEPVGPCHGWEEGQTTKLPGWPVHSSATKSQRGSRQAACPHKKAAHRNVAAVRLYQQKPKHQEGSRCMRQGAVAHLGWSRGAEEAGWPRRLR